MRKRINIKTGDKFDMWTVIGPQFTKETDRKNTFVECRCECGRTASIACYSLENKISTSCRSCATKKWHDQKKVYNILYLDCDEDGWMKCECGRIYKSELKRGYCDYCKFLHVKNK